MNRFLLFSLTLMLLFCGCKEINEDNHPKESVSMNTLESVIKAQIKSDLIAAGHDSNEFQEDMLPSYRSVFLKDNSLSIPIEYDLSALDDAIAIINKNTNNADLIAILKAKGGETTYAEGFARALRNFQISNSDSYLPDQMRKIEESILKTVGNYVIYISYDNPQRIENAILDAIQ